MRLAERESNQVGFDVQICPIPSSFPLDILPICPAGKAFGLEKICCVKTARTRGRMQLLMGFCGFLTPRAIRFGSRTAKKQLGAEAAEKSAAFHSRSHYFLMFSFLMIAR